MARLIGFWMACLTCISLSAKIGDACLSHDQCGFREQCIKEFKQGYCTAFNCSIKNPCGEEAACFQIPPEDYTICLATCSKKSDCRPGYQCYKSACIPEED